MNAKEFINYFKGGIELGQLTELNQANFKILATKLANITNERSEENAFCDWLKGVFDITEEEHINAKKLALILERLQQTQTIYLSPNMNKTNDKSNFVMRC